MSTAKDLVTLSLLLGFGVAILANADKASTIISTFGTTWMNLVRTVSNKGPA